MAETTQYAFELKEVVASLLQKEGITAGKWMLALEFTTTAGVFGTSPQDSRPGAMLQVNRVQLIRVPDDTTGNPLVVDASTLSHAPQEKTKPAGAPPKAGAIRKSKPA